VTEAVIDLWPPTKAAPVGANQRFLPKLLYLHGIFWAFIWQTDKFVQTSGRTSESRLIDGGACAPVPDSTAHGRLI